MSKDDKMRVDNLSKLMQERIEDEVLEFDPAAWEAMERKLDEHMPTGKKSTANATKCQQQINRSDQNNSCPAEKYSLCREDDKRMANNASTSTFFSGCTFHYDYFDYWKYNSTYPKSTLETCQRHYIMTKDVISISTDLNKPINPPHIISASNNYNLS